MFVIWAITAWDCHVFFFSSRRRHTSWNCDWSSDVCSSDLHGVVRLEQLAPGVFEHEVHPVAQLGARLLGDAEQHADRLERKLARDVDHEVAAPALRGLG